MLLTSSRHHRRAGAAVALVGLLLVLPFPASAASKRKVAALGDPAPGGGVFAGPGFVGSPSAAGTGWIAFRSTIADGGSSEQIVVRNMVSGRSESVATVGQDVSDSGGKSIGKLKQFLGRPAVNANGDVAFASIITPPAGTLPQATTPAGIFLRRIGGTVTVIALSGADAGGNLGNLDIASPVDILLYDPNDTDIEERTPAIDDAGRVSFLSSTLNDATAGAAIFTATPDGVVNVMVAAGDPAPGGGAFNAVAQPATSPGGRVAFVGHVQRDGGQVDGVFGPVGGQLAALATANFSFTYPYDPSDPLNAAQDITSIEDPVAIADDGTVAFLAGPLFDPHNDATIGLDHPDGLVVVKPGQDPRVVAYPSSPLRIKDGFAGAVWTFTLGASTGRQLVGPVLTPDGNTLAIVAALDSGSSQGVIRWQYDDTGVNPVWKNIDTLELDDTANVATPVGGTYLEAMSAVSLDATAAYVFTARIAGSTTSQAVFYLPLGGPGTGVAVGDAATQVTGFFAGQPFFPPHMNDAGDVVFKSYVAKGPGLGIYRARASDGALEAIVRANDPSPLDGKPFLDFPGDPAVDPGGNVAFAALVRRAGRGIFLATPAGIQAVVVGGDPWNDPVRGDAHFSVIAPNIAMRDDGSVVFHATITYTALVPPACGNGGHMTRSEGLFLADGTGIHRLVGRDDNSGIGFYFLRIRDAGVAGTNAVFRSTLELFQCSLDRSNDINALFLVNTPGQPVPVALEGKQTADGYLVDALVGRASVNADGRIATLARVADGPAVLAGTAGSLATVAVAGQASPAGGVYRSFGRPSVSSIGHVAYRASLKPGTGGLSGVFLAAGDAPVPYLLNGEDAGRGVDNGRLVGINQSFDVNSHDEIAYLGTISGGSARSGIFVASKSTVRAPRVAIRLGKQSTSSPVVNGNDRVRLQASLMPGSTSSGIAWGKGTLTLSLIDTGTESAPSRAVWSATVPPGELRGRGARRSLTRQAARKKSLAGLVMRGGPKAVRVTLASTAVDLTFLGNAPIRPPLTLRMDIGDDGAAVRLDCKTKGRSITCK